MTRKEIEVKSGAKVKQFMEMAKTLKIRVEAKNRIDEKGIIEPTVFYIDEEKYDMDPVETPEPAVTREPLEMLSPPVTTQDIDHV